jgi:flagellar motor switch/type III secretory pathway protein FliN
MADLTPEILSDVLAACNTGAEEAAGALGRTLDAKISVAVGESETLSPKSLPAELDGRGLAIIFIVGSSGAALVLPESTGLVPSWCAAPDPTGQSKLATLAQELGMTLLPETFMPDDSKTALVEKLSTALVSGGLQAGAASIVLTLSTEDGKRGIARLVWPLDNPSKVLESAVKTAPVAAAPAAAPAPSPASAAAAHPAEKTPPPAASRPRRARLPGYTKSLLKIKVPIVVTLAEKKQPLSQIVEMGPGMIIQFEKSCEDNLQLEIGDRIVAAGEAIKVGDKFGIRVTEIILPEERFNTIPGRMRLSS